MENRPSLDRFLENYRGKNSATISDANILGSADIGGNDITHYPRILSIDGGGVRGLSSLLILREIMEEIERQSSVENAKPCQYFDLIGGTGTGGLIAIMLGRLQMVLLPSVGIERRLTYSWTVSWGRHYRIYGFD
jgi:hypothetical protein